MTPLLPLVVRFFQRNCVVIGGGAVAARRARVLSEYGAAVTVVAPELTAELETLVSSATIRAQRRPYSAEVLEGAFLVVVATNDPDLNARVAADATAAGALVNDADEPERGDCIIPATVRRGELVISITTCGSSPSLASRIREALEGEFGPEYEPYVALLGEARRKALAGIADTSARRRALAALAADTEILELIRAGRMEEARAKAFACISLS